ncbi:hypothetical protein BN6_27040 [Saccharothrix espanaensis DSM 44229]|uniref:HNH nuclease domain-containing protein n=1 Tax=Saccharothrix espanaensis (strain ATCC 51144 / DSM 44229 / JCM 9112 / NBRC 15066 / NRRL 15764) TaxID=1179773 RepID=K0JVM2_SACES|nr:hypothetical protein BN6_27040 [Saccharothrix espanaensis DSM 44229]
MRTNGRRGAWLMLAAGTGQKRYSNDGYDDAPAAHYSWDSEVDNAKLPQVGDVIVLWDKKGLLGASVIEKIVTGEGRKVQNRCPYCGMTSINLRKVKTPRYRCYECTRTFEEPDVEQLDVTTYRTHHEIAWVDLAGELTSDQLRELCKLPKSQQSIRELDYRRFERALRTAPGLPSLSPVEAALATELSGGHTTAVVRVRRGQGAFRSRLLNQYGDRCAFTGPTPRAALEAAHLNSFATDGKHHDQGGLLFRRDIHRLFDLGHLAVDPRELTIDVAATIADYPEYGRLHGEKLHVDLTTRQLGWIKKHWTMHRG